jgi:hypothetical protein
MPCDSARVRMDAGAVDFTDQYSKVCLEKDAIDVGHLRVLDGVSA